jgi:sarcosine oxidase subunit alpha
MRSRSSGSRRGISTSARTRSPTTPRRSSASSARWLRWEGFAAARSLERLGELPIDRKLVGFEFDRGGAELRGVPLRIGGRILGRVTSAGWSPTLERSIGLGWIRREPGGAFPDTLHADRVTAHVVPTPFLDPEGERLRG